MNLFPFKFGNKKIGNDTLIFNMNPAHSCPARELGLCQVPVNRCYAFKDEQVYKHAKEYRERQRCFWAMLPTEKIAEQFRKAIARRRIETKYIRVSEAGDFFTEEDVRKLCTIASLLPSVRVYAYTARRDFNWEQLKKEMPENLTINGSGFMVHNEFRVVQKATHKYPLCKGDCRQCTLCKGEATRQGIVIEEELRKR